MRKNFQRFLAALCAALALAALAPFVALATPEREADACFRDAIRDRHMAFAELESTEGVFVFEAPDGSILTFTDDYNSVGYYNFEGLDGISQAGKYTLKSYPVPEGYEADGVSFYSYNNGLEEYGGFTVEQPPQDGVWEGQITIYLQQYAAPVPDGINVAVNGRYVTFPDQRPEIIDDRTYLPVRFVAEELGAGVNWVEERQGIQIYGPADLFMTIGSKTLYVGFDTMELDAAPLWRNGRAMVPIRFVAEALGYSVGWDEESRTVLLTN